jgi:hypothetical protein
MKQALVFITLAGCSQIFGLETPREVDAFVPSRCMQDRFTNDTIDPRLWDVVRDKSTIEAVGGQLVFTLPTDTVKNVVGSTNAIDVSTATVQIEVVQATEQTFDAVTRFFVGTDAQHYLEMRTNNNLLVANTVATGIDDKVMRAWDPVAFRFWAIAYDASTETATFATSPNGTTWNALRTIQVPLASSARIELGADNTLQSGADPGKAIFDNFVVLTPSCAP